jgi:TonB-linked SusC/RagA family outer membrane protein
MKKIVMLLTLLMVSVLFVFGQTIPVTGTVTNDKGEILPYATVTETGTTNAVKADEKGFFSIIVRGGSTITISVAGYSSRVIAATAGNEKVVLIANEQLSEVVVTAMGVRRSRNQLPYAAQQLKGEDISKVRSSNFLTGLSGKSAGLDIKQTNTLGGSTNVVLRGIKSITGDNQALFVVDGVPYNNSNTNTVNQRTARGGYDYGNAAADINPDDIESITVLKGAASSALYGSQGANGVILITTKKGKKGLGVTLNSGFSMGMVDKSTFAKYQMEYGAGYDPDQEDPSGWFLYRDINGDGIPDLVAPMQQDASYGPRFNPNLMVYQWDAFDPASPNYKKARPWVAAANGPFTFFEKAFSSNQSVFVDGGSDKGTFKLGYTRNDDNGILPNSRIEKNLVNFSSTYSLSEKLLAGASVNFTNIEGKGRYGTGYDELNVMTSFRQWWQTNVDIKEQKEAYFRNRKNITWNWADPNDLTPIYWDNPYFARHESYETDRRNRYFGNINLNYKVTEWLNLLGRISLDSYDEIQEERMAKSSKEVASYSRFNRSFRETNFDLMMNVDKEISKNINFKGLLGVNVRRQYSESIRASTNGGLIVDRVYSLSNSFSTPNAPTEFQGTREVDGAFAGATFAWKDMITLDGTVRRDVSSTLPKGNNVYYYPSVSGGFVFSKLTESLNWLSYGKLRVNYAQVGSDAPLYALTDEYVLNPPFGSDPQLSLPTVKNNGELRPERTNSTELGLEMAFLKSRLGFDINYYNSRSIDQIIPAIISRATGYFSKYVNAGTIENKGIELSVNGTPVQTKDFSWNIGINWSRNRNKVLELFEGAQNLVLANFQGGVSQNATVGQPYGTIRGTNFIYTNGQKTVNSNGYYLKTTTNNEVIGDPNPDWIGGITNNFRLKNVTVSFLVDVRKGGDVFSLDMSYGLYSGMYPETAGLNDKGKPSRDSISKGGGVILPGVKQDGKPNDIRVENFQHGLFGTVSIPDAGFVYDASYVKLREAVITYSLPKSAVARLAPFKGIDFSLIGRNLWIIHKNLPYADPEENISAGNLQGYQSGAYPTARTFTFNIKLKF